MRALNIIESVYSGVPYKDSEKVLVDPTEVNLAFKFEFSRFSIKSKLNKIPLEPYKIDFNKYCEILSRVKVVPSINSSTLTIYSGQEEFEPFITEYGSSNAVITEPLHIEDLLYSHEEISPLGILALIFRKSFGNDRFKRLINSTLLKEYKKVKLNNGPNIYIRNDFDILLTSCMTFRDSGMSWKDISTFLIPSPYIFIWRDNI